MNSIFRLGFRKNINFSKIRPSVSKQKISKPNFLNQKEDKSKENDDKKENFTSNNRDIWKDFVPKTSKFLAFLFCYYIVKYLSECYQASSKFEMTWMQFNESILKNNYPMILYIDLNQGKLMAILKENSINNHKVFIVNMPNIEICYDRLFSSITEFEKFKNIDIRYINLSSNENSLSNFFSNMIFVIIFAYILSNISMLMGKPFGIQQLMNIKSQVSMFQKSQSKIHFKDVLGCDEAKIEVEEISTFLKNFERYKDMGADLPKGAILYGPPGTGKTMLAKALANECNVPLYTSTGSDFVQSIVGVGAHHIRNLFDTAKKNAPSIIFIDEIDSIARSREGKSLSGVQSNDTTINQILVEMDGFTTNNQVIVLAATNQLEVIDKALLRPGRFDRHVYVGIPARKGREELLRHYLSKIQVDSFTTEKEKKQLIEKLTDITTGFSGADIANICNEAAVIAVRNDQNSVSLNHLNSAIDRVIAGSYASKKISPEDKHKTAVHESGHAIVSYFSEDPLNIAKISIVPRGQALGYNLMIPKDTYMKSRKEMFAKMCTLLGGRAAEQVYLKKISANALDDLQKVTKIAYQYFGLYGFDVEGDLGNISYQTFSNNNIPDIGHQHLFDTDLANKLDVKVMSLIDKAYKNSLNLIEENKEICTKLINELVTYETLSKDQIDKILCNKQ